ncbi:hypothetical protein MJK72_04370 [Klebsiella pneumoniae]|nr:hypothetical protein MJK72_04370 [Klebsiella pneumoniae]
MTLSALVTEASFCFAQYDSIPAALFMLLAVRDWLLPLSRLVSEETDTPPLTWALLPLSWLAALLRESCREAAWAPERVNAK